VLNSKVRTQPSFSYVCWAFASHLTCRLRPADAKPMTSPSVRAAHRLKYNPRGNWIRHYSGRRPLQSCWRCVESCNNAKRSLLLIRRSPREMLTRSPVGRYRLLFGRRCTRSRLSGASGLRFGLQQVNVRDMIGQDGLVVAQQDDVASGKDRVVRLRQRALSIIQSARNELL
jgi:hypothetical protein